MDSQNNMQFFIIFPMIIQIIQLLLLICFRECEAFTIIKALIEDSKNIKNKNIQQIFQSKFDLVDEFQR